VEISIAWVVEGTYFRRDLSREIPEARFYFEEEDEGYKANY
jgi:hypothetical protein